MTEIWRMGAAELATRIRERDVSSREVVQAHLDRIQAVNPKTQRGDRGAGGVGARGGRRRRRSGAIGSGVRPAVRRADDGEGEHGRRRLRDHLRSGGAAQRHRQGGWTFGGEPARRRRDSDRTHQHARVRRALAHRERAVGRHAQPVVGRAHAGSVERRRGGGAGGRPLAARPRQRRRRVAAVAGAVLRRRRAQAIVRARAARSRRRARWRSRSRSRSNSWPPTDRWRATCATCGSPSRPCARDRWAIPGRSRRRSKVHRSPRPIRVAVAEDPGGLGVHPDVAAAVRRAAAALEDAGYVVEQRDPPALARANEIYTQIMMRFGRTTEELPSTAGLVGDEFQRFWDAWNPVWTAACGEPVYDPLSERASLVLPLGHVPRRRRRSFSRRSPRSPRSGSTPSSTPTGSRVGRRRCA